MPDTARSRTGLQAFKGDVDDVRDIDTINQGQMNTLEAIVAIDDQGIFSARPTSTVGSPGKRGRYYYVKGDPDPAQNGRLYRDHGTGWDEITTRRCLYGRVTSAGAIGDAGSGGWSVTRTGAGVYAITFALPFAAVPSVVACPAAPSGSPTIGVDVPTATGVTVRTRIDAASADTGFTFQVIGV